MKLSNNMLRMLAAGFAFNGAVQKLPMNSTDIICLLAMQSNFNGLDDCMVQLDAGHRPWDLKLADLKAIEGEWRMLPVEYSDVTDPDWSLVGIGDADGELELHNSPGVNYVGSHMVIVGYNGECQVFWVFKKAL